VSGEDICAAVFLRFYDKTGARRQVSLPEARGIRFLDELAADGSASYTASLLAQAFGASPDLLEDGICKAALVLGAGEAPTEVFGWELVPTDGTLVGEPVEKEAQATAPGLRHLLTYAPVFPEVGGVDTNSEDARAFGWMSAASSYWDSTTGWITPLVYRQMGTEALGMTAWWITADTTPAVGDVNLFRSTFSLTADTPLRIYYAGDDTVRLFLNSELIGEQNPSSNEFSSVDVTVGAGTHTLAAEVTQLYPSTAGPGQGELKFGCAVTKMNTSPPVVLRVSDSTHWTTYKVTGSKPGFTAAGIFLKLLAEAQAAGVYGVNLLTTDFTSTHDSAGTSWPDLQERAFPTGQTSLADVVTELEEVAFDLRIKPDFTVQAFVSQGTDKHTTVVLRPGVNLLRMTYRGSPVRATRALVRSLEGWTEVVNSAGEAAYGKRYIGITSGVAASNAQGAQLGDNALGDLARPVYTYTATIRAVVGAVPYRDFGVGDRITAPVRGGTGVLRVLSITPSTPDDVPGPVTFTLELAAP
jgi:hypothetical protein